MHDATLDIIARFVSERSRLSFGGHKKAFLKSRVHERMAQVGATDMAGYLELVLAETAEQATLLELLTTNETCFFRNPRQFDYLRTRIIPALEEERGRDVIRSWGQSDQVSPRSIMKLRILCAGCSTGEEPYSVAMTLLEGLRYPTTWDICIDAGDLSERCVNAARDGVYDEAQLKGVVPSYRDRFLVNDGERGAVRDEVKRLVRFSPFNLKDLMEGVPYPGYETGEEVFDMVFCRNVMIYFSAQDQQRLVDTLHRLLVPGGYLFTGDAEPLHLFQHDFEAAPGADCLIYQKREMRNDVETGL